MASNILDPVAAESGGEGQTFRGPNLLQIIWQRKSLVVLGVVIGMILGVIYWSQKTPVYMSAAQILVVQSSPRVTATGSQDMRSEIIDSYISTLAVLIKSQVIVERAANDEEIKNGLQSFPEATSPPALAASMMQGLQVARDNKETMTQAGNNILVLSFKGPVAEECPLVLRKVVKHFQEYLNEVYKNVSDNTLKHITNAQMLLGNDIERENRKYAELRQKSPALITKYGGRAIYEQRLSKLEEARSARRMELLEKQQRLALIEKVYKEQGQRAAIQAIMGTGAKVSISGDRNLDELLAPWLYQERQLIAQGLGPGHPKRKAVKEAIEHIKQTYMRPGDNKDPNASAKPEETQQDNAMAFINTLRFEVIDLQNLLANYDAQYEKEFQEAKELNAWEVEEEGLKNKIRNQQMLYESIVKQLTEINIVRDAGGIKADVISQPGLGRKIAPNPYQVFTAAGLLGALLGVGLAYLAEISDKSFRTPLEIRRRLGLPVIGHIPFMAADEKAQSLVATGAATLDPMLITYYQSNSIGSEAYRGVRTALYFSTQGVGHQVIQVTSPNVSDGKSTLAANLAVSIAQSGKKTVLLDADFRKPRAHKIFNVPAQVGLASVIAGQAPISSAVQQSVIDNLSIMPCGPRPVNPAELLTQPEFKKVLEELRQQYDFVIVDTPPILVVTDPSVVAPRVDGVVLCIRVTKNGRPYAERAKEVLASINANVLGVVVNGFGSQIGGNKYGYEHYQYGYGEGQGYGYGYGYGYGETPEAASYYGTEREPDAEVAAAKR